MIINVPKILPKIITDKYDIVRNTFIDRDKKELYNEFEIEVGDAKQDSFFPQLKIKRWDNECNFSVRLIDDDPDIPKIETENNKIKYIKNKLEAHFYDVPKTEKMPDSYEFEIILKEKPKTNKIQMSIESRGLSFNYQLESTQKEKDAGVFIPENMIGSYAVYHKSKQGDYSKMGGKNYKSGKAFLIPKPQIMDANGWKVWGKLNITGSILSIEIPQEFLDDAVYPIRHASGLEFGNIGIGGSRIDICWNGSNNSTRRGNSFASPGNVALESIVAYLEGKTAVYDAKVFANEKNSGGIGTHAQIATKENTGIALLKDWRIFALSNEEILSERNYLLSAMAHNIDDIFIYYDNIDWLPDENYEEIIDIEAYVNPENPWVDSPTSKPSAWVVSTFYESDSPVRVLVEGKWTSYYCIQNHTSSVDDEPGVGVNWEDYWEFDSLMVFKRYSIYAIYIVDLPVVSPNLTNRKNYNGYLAFVQQFIKHRLNDTTPWASPDGYLLS